MPRGPGMVRGTRPDSGWKGRRRGPSAPTRHDLHTRKRAAVSALPSRQWPSVQGPAPPQCVRWPCQTLRLLLLERVTCGKPLSAYGVGRWAAGGPSLRWELGWESCAQTRPGRLLQARRRVVPLRVDLRLQVSTVSPACSSPRHASHLKAKPSSYRLPFLRGLRYPGLSS